MAMKVEVMPALTADLAALYSGDRRGIVFLSIWFCKLLASRGAPANRQQSCY
jgi:hypothetical protein